MGGFDHPEANAVWIDKLIKAINSRHLRHCLFRRLVLIVCEIKNAAFLIKQENLLSRRLPLMVSY